MFTKLGSFLARRAKATLVIGGLLVVLAAGYGSGVFGSLMGGSSQFQNLSSESRRARELLAEKSPVSQEPVIILFEAKGDRRIDEPAVEKEINQLTATITADEALVDLTPEPSADGSSRYVLVFPESSADRLVEDIRALQGDHVDIKVGGMTALIKEVNEQIEKDLVTAEIVSFAILAVLLVIIFRSLIAAALPLLLGGIAIVGAFAITRGLTELTDISSYAINIITLVGLGLAIDYSLLIVSRFREELQRQPDVAQAVRTTVATAGRTVFFSGLTVIVSLLALLVFPLGFLQSMAWGGSAAVIVAMLVALTILPAVLRLLGHKVNALSFGKVRRVYKAQKAGGTIEEKPSIWWKTGRFFMNHPWPFIVLTLGVLLVAGLPFLRVTLANPDHRSLPETSQARQVAESLVKDFGQPSYPVQIAYDMDNEIPQPADVEALELFEARISELPNAGSIQHQYVAPGVAQINVSYEGATEDATTQQLVADIRALETPVGTEVLVGGEPGDLYDLKQTLIERLPYGLGIVILAMFVLLFLMLGSFVIPLKAMAMNFVSLSAAYGAMVLIFQDGHLTDLLNLGHTGSLDASMPILIFAVAFGMSMDYSVFLYSRIKEEFDKTGDNTQSVLAGLQRTGSIITSAALLLFVVIAAFATSRIPLMQQIGVGLSLTILIDAFLVRMVLVPSLMKVLGRYNWWAPKKLKALQQRLGFGE